MLLLELLISMVLAKIICSAIGRVLLTFFERRFIRSVNSIDLLFCSVSPYILNGFKDERRLQISVKYCHSISKVKFRDSLEAVVEIEKMIRRSMKCYKIVLFILGEDHPEEKEQIDEVQKYLEEISQEMGEMVKSQESQSQQEEL